MSFGLLSIAGILSLVLGTTILFKSSPEVSGIGVNMKTLMANIIGIVIVVIILAYIVLKAHLKKVSTGREAMIGRKIMLKNSLKKDDKILIDGEWWDCICEEDIESGSLVEIYDIEGFKLKIRKVDNGGRDAGKI
jgi:membrane-bound serine protease (ClpP class)